MKHYKTFLVIFATCFFFIPAKSMEEKQFTVHQNKPFHPINLLKGTTYNILLSSSFVKGFFTTIKIEPENTFFLKNLFCHKSTGEKKYDILLPIKKNIFGKKWLQVTPKEDPLRITFAKNSAIKLSKKDSLHAKNIIEEELSFLIFPQSFSNQANNLKKYFNYEKKLPLPYQKIDDIIWNDFLLKKSHSVILIESKACQLLLTEVRSL